MGRPHDLLPTGTVTFLFTDIEGSTSLLAELGDGYRSLQERHGAILRDAVTPRGGIEVNTEGDAFFVVFPSARDALRATVAAQLALESEAWPDHGSIRVRMGLHTGEGRLGGDDYLGLDVNRAARIAAAAHGGQVVLSEATHGLVADDLPDGVGVHDLGLHRLKDLPDPEHLWQLEIEGLPARFPAIRTLDARPTNLPTLLTPLIGRGDELVVVRGLLESRPVVTLTGPGGTGKTRLAIAVAASLLDDHPDGVFFVDLQDARDRVAVASGIASVIGVRERVDRGPEEAVTAFMRERACLLVLDNFEQVVVAAPMVSDLVTHADRLRAIVTSREALRIAGEQEYAVPPLGVPSGDGAATPEELLASESVALFVQRAREVRPDFELSESNARHVAGIASRLDGLPLAIELAAARVRLLTPEAILARLDRSLTLLAGGGRDRPGRQQTLRGAIDWSYELLDDGERRLFARLAAFAGGWTIDAAELVCGPEADEPDLFEAMGSLVEKSLVRALPMEAGEPRFDMLKVIHEYAADKLAADPEADAVRRRHATWAMELAERAEPELMRAALREWHARLETEKENLRAALRWAIEEREAEIALRIAGPLWRHWHYQAAAREGREWLEAALALPGSGDWPAHRARALSGLAGLVYWQGRMEEAARIYDEALAIRRSLGDAQAVADVLRDSAWASYMTGQLDEGRERAAEAIGLFRSVGDETSAVLTEAWVTTMAVLGGSGGSIDEALEAARRAVEVSHAAGRPFEEADWLSSTAYGELMRGDLDAAFSWGHRAVRLFRELGAVGWFAPYFKMFAGIENARGNHERAARLGAAAARYAEEIGGELPEEMFRAGDPLSESAAFLAPEAHQRAVREGRAMSLDEAVAYALGDEATDIPGGSSGPS